MLLYIILAIALSGFLGLSGGLLLLWQENRAKRISGFMVSFAIGAMLVAVFTHLLPELINGSPKVETSLILVLLGILIFYLLEKLLIVYHCHENDECEVHTSSTLIIISDTIHNFLDGTIIAGAFLVDFRLGIITTLAVLFHEIPQEISDFAVMLHNQMKPGKIIFYNLLSAAGSLVGGLFVWFLKGEVQSLSLILIALATGNFIYIALTDLVPMTNQDRGTKNTLIHFLVLLLGLAVMYGAGLLISE
ncbi:MAG: ZIP family metal transporter [Patescibacteria group bacterium]|jgi:zinc and cadmium transporter